MAEQSESLAKALASRPLLGFVTLERVALDTAGTAPTKVVTSKVGGVKLGSSKAGVVKESAATE